MGTPALDGPLLGSIYIGEPQPGNQYRLFMVADGFGLHAKLVGSVQPDPSTGQLTADFDDLPQVPFEEFNLHLFASDRGLIATPTRCALYDVQASSSPGTTRSPQSSNQIFSFDSGPDGAPVPRPGAALPSASRGRRPRNPVAGDFSDFTPETRP